MGNLPDNTFSRRRFIRGVAIASAGLSLGPYFVFGKAQPTELMKRQLGRIGFEATTLGMGGQASLEWDSGRGRSGQDHSEGL